MFRITVPLDDEYSFDYGSITGNRSAIEKNDNIKNVEKVPIETEKVPIDNLSTQLRSIFQFVKENGRFIEYNKISRRADLCVR